MDGEKKINLILDIIKDFGNFKGFKPITEKKLDAIFLFQRSMRENMKVGGFRLAATLYYTSNKYTP